MDFEVLRFLKQSMERQPTLKETSPLPAIYEKITSHTPEEEKRRRVNSGNIVSAEDPEQAEKAKTVTKSVKRLNKNISFKTAEMNELMESIQELQYARYQEIRRRNPEFKSFDDREITIYIDLFDKNNQESFQPHNMTLFVLGGIILCVDWFMFNAGSSINIDPAIAGNDPANTFVCTCLAACAGGITAVFVRLFEANYIDDEPLNKFDLVKLINGVMSACVGVTASSSEISFLSALAIGATSTLWYMGLSRLAPRIMLDDPLEVSIIHGFCGFWGVLCVGLFSQENGLFVNADTYQLKVQLIGGISLILLALIPALAFFAIAKKLNRLRVGEIFEILGQDVLDKHDMDIKKQIKNRDKNKLNNIDSIIVLE